VVFVSGTGEDGRRTQLFVRAIEAGTLHALDGTEDARYPFWSPESDSIAFASNGQLRVVELSRSRIRVVCSLPEGRITGGTWNQQGVMLFSSPGNVPIAQVRADGKTPVTSLTAVFGEAPAFLPDGRHVLYSGGPTSQGLHLVDLESGTITTLRPDGRRPKYAAGHLLFVQDGRLVAQPFDLKTLTLSGETTELAEMRSPAFFGNANDRLVVYTRVEDTGEQLTWRSRNGAPLGTIGGDGDWYNPELSPDDASVAAQRNQFQGTGPDIWVHDFSRAVSRAIASERQSELMPFWSSDGARVWFMRDDVGVFEKPSSGGAERRVSDFAAAAALRVTGISHDGRHLVTFRMNDQNNRDIFIVPLAAETPPFSFAQSAANEMQPALSPDGRWLAYVTDELGTNQQQADVFVQAFPDGGHKVRVSATTDGGAQPRWRKDGRELFFVAKDQRLMALAVEESGEVLRLGPARPLFRMPFGPVAGLATRAGYDVTRDGQRFIIAEPRPGGRTSALAVVVNWTTALTVGRR
jgi:Tol biopolymer transport system component